MKKEFERIRNKQPMEHLSMKRFMFLSNSSFLWRMPHLKFAITIHCQNTFLDCRVYLDRLMFHISVSLKENRAKFIRLFWPYAYIKCQALSAVGDTKLGHQIISSLNRSYKLATNYFLVWLYF